MGGGLWHRILHGNTYDVIINNCRSLYRRIIIDSNPKRRVINHSGHPLIKLSSTYATCITGTSLGVNNLSLGSWIVIRICKTNTIWVASITYRI